MNVHKNIERMLMKRLRKAGLHPEFVTVIAICQFPPHGDYAWFSVWGMPQDEHEDLKALLATDEFKTFGETNEEFFNALWSKDVSALVKAQKVKKL